ncbi:hypothetical protein PDJAM_G00254440 [Pangasius djambal]|uniref:Uncharacterized protein n=1 Tax=Pangasius djambal TaxID=1691987 RepID=A0ACC5YKG7_9TELE|nr:hypothetical protein [Pangasius djambal]
MFTWGSPVQRKPTACSITLWEPESIRSRTTHHSCARFRYWLTEGARILLRRDWREKRPIAASDGEDGGHHELQKSDGYPGSEKEAEREERQGDSPSKKLVGVESDVSRQPLGDSLFPATLALQKVLE